MSERTMKIIIYPATVIIMCWGIPMCKESHLFRYVFILGLCGVGFLEAYFNNSWFRVRIYGAVGLLAIWEPMLVDIANDPEIPAHIRPLALFWFAYPAFLWLSLGPLIMKIIMKIWAKIDELITSL